MLIPSIDLMNGKIVQLVQGEKKALEFDDIDYWIERFSKYPIVQVIDLDAARGVGNNRAIVSRVVQRLNCQVGGGIRNLEIAQEVLALGAHRIILGSALLSDGSINTEFAATLANAIDPSALVFCARFPRWPRRHRWLAQRHGSYGVRNDSRSRALLRDLSVHAHRHRRFNGRHSI